jgi:glycosyltransferase involved in cell wall biosynthesis
LAKIGIDARMMGTLHAGIGRYVFELARHMVRQHSEHEYFLFYNSKNFLPQELEEFKKFKHVSLVPVPIRHYSIMEQLKFASILDKYNLDLVHFPNFNVPLLYKKPFITTIHDVVHHKISGHKKSRLLHFLAYKKIIEHAAVGSKAIITVSNYSKKDIAGTFRVPEGKIKVIYEGTSLPHLPDVKFVEEVKKRYLLDKPYFLFVGTLERKKNVVHLTRGFDELVKKHGTDMLLVLAGRVDRHYPEIKHHAMDIKNRERLVFTGYVEDDELVALYNGAYAFVSASQHEGFGLPGVEAMKYGLPLVVSNIDVFNEVYDNAAVFFNANDPKDIAEKLHLVAKDSQFHRQLQLNSVKRSELFSWEQAADETMKIYEEAMSNGHPSDHKIIVD